MSRGVAPSGGVSALEKMELNRPAADTSETSALVELSRQATFPCHRLTVPIPTQTRGHSLVAGPGERTSQGDDEGVASHDVHGSTVPGPGACAGHRRGRHDATAQRHAQ